MQTEPSNTGEQRKPDRWPRWLWALVGRAAPTPKPYKDEPCFIVRYDGEVMESTLRTFSGGQMAVWCVVAWKEAYPDGKITPAYSLATKWHRP